MRYRNLGRTGLSVSEVGFGAWAIGGKWWGPQDDQDSRLALHEALDRGCNFIDTAWVYGDGHSEKLIGRVLKERNQPAIVATKVPPKNWNWDNRPGTPLSAAFPPDWVEQKLDESLRHLGRDTVEVLQLHTWNREWNAQAGPLLDRIARLKRSGKIRAFGISLRDRGADEANDLVRRRMVDSLQVFFNLFYQEPIKGLFTLAGDYGVGLVARVPLAFGALSGRFTKATRFLGDDHRRRLYEGARLEETLHKVKALEFLKRKDRDLAESAIQWTLAFPQVSTSIPGIRNPRQARMNLRAGDGVRLTPAEVAKTRKLYPVNFGQPIRKLEAGEQAPAIFVSGVREIPAGPVPQARPKAVKPKRGKAAPKKKSRTARKKPVRPVRKAQKKAKKRGKR